MDMMSLDPDRGRGETCPATHAIVSQHPNPSVKPICFVGANLVDRNNLRIWLFVVCLYLVERYSIRSHV